MGDLKGMNAKKVVMVVGIMTLHAFSEGLGVGVSYGGENGRQQGTFMTLAIGVHNIPEGLAVALVSVPRGESPARATLWAIISSLPQPLVAIPSFYFVQLFSFLLPYVPSLPPSPFLSPLLYPHPFPWIASPQTSRHG